MKYHVIRIVIIAVYIIGINSCAPKINTIITNTSFKPLSDSTQIAVIDFYQPLPDSGTYIGSFSTKYAVDSRSYGTFIDSVKIVARHAGGNAIAITGFEPQYSQSLCYNIQGEILRYSNPVLIANKLKHYTDSISEAKSSVNAQYATLHVFTFGNNCLIGYKLHVDSIKMGQIHSGSIYEFKLYKEGLTKVWAKTIMSSSILPSDAWLNVKFGEEYFVNSGCVPQNPVDVTGEAVLVQIKHDRGLDILQYLKNGAVRQPLSSSNTTNK